MISSTIGKLIAQALKSKDEIRLSTLRLLSSALNYEKIAKQHELSEEEEIVVVKREAKKRQDAIEAYEKAGALDRAEKEKQELSMLKEFLPEEIGEDELLNVIDQIIMEVGASDIKDFGKVMGLVMDKAKGRADGKKVAEIVRSKLG